MDLKNPILGNSQGVVHAVVVGGLAYIGFIVLLRLFGKGTLADVSAPTVVTTASFGSGLATIALDESVGLTEGLVGFFVLMMWQLLLIRLVSRSVSMSRLVRGSPLLVYFEGRYFERAMRRNGLSREDIWAAARKQGLHEMQSVGAIVLENNGGLSAVRRPDSGQYSALDGVKNYPPLATGDSR